MAVLELDKVNKKFGDMKVISDLSFQVTEHSVFGFIGKNGAGKTTTMKMILGFLQQDSGAIRVCGEKVSYGNTKTNRNIGYLPDVPEYYGYMNPREYLRLCGEITGLSKEAIRSRTGELLELVGLEGVNRKVHGFSRGMKQRLGIAQALLNEPKLLICDEPTSALDPVGRKEILDILSLAKDRTTILFSTHILSDVERICDSIGVLNQGKLVLGGNVADIRHKYRKDIIGLEIGGQYPVEKAAAGLKELAFVNNIHISGQRIEVEVHNAEDSGAGILAFLLKENIPVIRYEIMEPSLENVFLEVVG
ncbi:ABC-2 type transport system ATP-binding protein [Anaerocolumna jejuensis DSM 15929]|uniref:ABC-2 type transport system ATP-binding protein n=1 Tax=Anaerocolumna jejuensis DSM 15929 TaxID=1121322 RepID=A0A1M6Y483_9FIRM|nr:ABC transporter ATP-binding protein [Anaerocolumna jejuensis]SHL13046.1 ABC-2 type transport system ATP-binding protein [Anaerocolumna jejuensis DSM 15929]